MTKGQIILTAAVLAGAAAIPFVESWGQTVFTPNAGTVARCSMDGIHWFAARDNGICYAADSDKIITTVEGVVDREWKLVGAAVQLGYRCHEAGKTLEGCLAGAKAYYDESNKPVTSVTPR